MSSIGLNGGIQPIAKEDRSLWIAFNGKADDHPKPRLDVEKIGNRFATATDSEVVLYPFSSTPASP